MPTLENATIATTYDQLLHVDRDGGGNTTNHVAVKDGNNDTTFGFTIATDALMMTGTNRLEFGDNGTYIYQSTNGILDLVADVETQLTTALFDLNASGQIEIDSAGDIQMNASAGNIYIGNNDVDRSINIGTAGERTINIGTGSFADEVVIGNTTGASGIQLLAGTGDIEVTGNIGIGVAAPATILTLKKSVSIFVAEATWTGDALLIDNSGISAGNGTTNTTGGAGNGSAIAFTQLGSTNRGAAIASYQAGDDEDETGLRFYHSGASGGLTLGMSLASSGNVGIGTSGPGSKLVVTNDTGGDGQVVYFSNSHTSIDDNDNILKLAFDADGDASEGNFIIFSDSDTAEMGVIKASNATVSIDAYSDYRIKDKIKTLTGGLGRVNKLRPVTYIYKTQRDKNYMHEGFIAHEVQEHISYPVGGKKDAVNDDGSVKKQSFCIYKLIPQLVSAIQELSAKVTALENA